MSQSAEQFHRKILSLSPTDRLEAARYFAEHAVASDERILREAVAKESVLWIKSALRRAIARVSPNPPSEVQTRRAEQADLPTGFAEQMFAEALETTASQLLHEIEPLLGTLRLSAEAEVGNYEASNTRRSIERIDEFLGALSKLRRAASPPKIEEFALDEMVSRCAEELQAANGIRILKVGAVPCIVEGDSGLVALCVSNGLRNAVEATVATAGELTELPVTAAWGTTDVDNWVSILDVGIGFKGNLQKAFEIGSTTKEGHLGMGLAIAEQAMTSLGGRLSLVPNNRGVKFELRWPKRAS
jgi:signal transduction histidine kinase